MDVLTKEQRSYCMSQIRGKDTKTELGFRKYVWNKGLKTYRVKNKIKGRPDMYFPKRKIAVFIDGCFWHKCPRCFVEPKSNKKFWREKIKKNIQRDLDIGRLLRKQNIMVIRFWGHEIKNNPEKCYNKLIRKLKYEKK